MKNSQFCRFKDILLSQRFFFMGIGMLLILCFHVFTYYGIQPLKTLFSRGFYGVDIFLFFSALGCSFSYTKNEISVFYKNRAKRILPLLMVLIIFRILWQYLFKGMDVDLWEILVTFTGLSYFKVFGGIRVDWYLSALVILYVSFPLFFKFVERYKTGGGNFCWLHFFHPMSLLAISLGT